MPSVRLRHENPSVDLRLPRAVTGLGPTRQVAPVQLLPHPSEKPVAAEPDEADAMIGASHVNAFAGRESAARLPVERHQKILGPPLHRLDHDSVRRRHHERPNRERVRGDRRDHHRLDARDHDRAPGTEGVGRGSRRSRDDDAVGAVRTDVLALDEHVDADHTSDAALVYGNIVHRDRHRPNLPIALLDRGGQGLAPLGDEAPRHERVERRLDGVARRRGEKADTAEVDAEDGGLASTEKPCAPEEGAVTAEGDERVEIHRLEVRHCTAPERLEPRLAVEMDATGGSLGGQLLEDRLEAGVPGIADHADLHRASRLSSCWSAAIRRAMPAAVSPNSSSCSTRGACSITRSGTPRATTRTSG